MTERANKKPRMDQFLVVGADKGIGLALFETIQTKGTIAVCTTRRKDGKGILLDLAQVPDDLNLGDNLSCAFICAAQSTFAACENAPEETFRVNVEGTLAVAKSLLKAGCFVIFLSSSAVFDGTIPYPGELSELRPSTEYGRQKSIAEKRLFEIDDGLGRVAIVRLTKVLTNKNPIIRHFINQIRTGCYFDAFCDLRFSPVSMSYVVESLLKIASKKIGGIFHLSGETELSYSEFARKMAYEMNVDPAIVIETSSSIAQVYFKPRFPSLAMPQTKELIGLEPEPIDIMLRHLLSGCQQPV